MHDYNNSLTPLQQQLLGDGTFSIPEINISDDDIVDQTFIWPKTIDGFAPDSEGDYFEHYKNNILNAAEKVDAEKTDIFIKTVIPENYLELDSDGQIYRTIIQTYAQEFDKLKHYIDAMAYAHSVDYISEESVPNKFMTKLGQLLGWNLSNSFNELDLFDYLTSDVDGNSNSYSHFNTEIWKRVLVNLIWLYKKKGTRDAIMFIFKLMGAPESLINFNEFVYDINQQVVNLTDKVDNDGYINYNSSLYVFQQGGSGRGDGKNYINQWMPEFHPIARIDNDKTYVGDSIYGTRNIINTKEVSLGISPSKAVETDVFEFFQKPCSYWHWSSTCISFSAMTVPFEYLTYVENVVRPTNITAMTLTQWIDNVYMNAIDPTTRKTNNQNETTWSYPELKNIYLSYYLATYPENNHLTIGKLEAYLQLLELQMGGYIMQLLPSTTIFEDGVATMYKNPVFHRQRYVYKEGVDKGSMYKRYFPDDLNPIINTPSIGISVVPSIKSNITINNITITNLQQYSSNISTSFINCKVNHNSTNANISSVNISNIYISDTSEELTGEIIFI